ncbi:PQQ-binding-like beta-propeller repeat protein [Prosthecobacter sp.]|uniref:PQQ-binding-like beta-propeller repeat protein n=1 Tax=Prosthecobacter sp. TaxID=1965333 RepID=UPI002ABA31B7|nr:PQQ-binding-like beta-propeller repeat protein [Prosthecobacter sp.]MDZ4404880.1 PQQ-binding-like beta-propeller repeat protein [Prosthecobacter sp.]
MTTRTLLFATALVATPILAADWPAWRGPTMDGHAAAGQTLPVKWSESENVLWKAEVRGRGHGSPIVVGHQVVLATADVETEEQLVLCFDRATGKKLWESVVHRGNLNTKGHKISSQASSDVVSDGERFYVNFLNNAAIFTTALDLSGKQLWQRRVCDFQVHQGFGSSPVVYQNIVLVSADHRGGGKMTGLNKLTGEVVWQQDRPPVANYSTPAVLTAAGKLQAVLAGCNKVESFDPLTGTKLWSIDGSTEETVVTAVTDGNRVFLGGGYPKNHTMALEADGSGKIAWENVTKTYVPSMLVKNGHVFAVGDAGRAVCWKSATGEELWNEKVDREFFGSPVMADSRIYATSKGGVTSVFEATPEKFTLLGQNQLGDESFSTPAICGNRIYLRSAKTSPARQEYLWCVGE